MKYYARVTIVKDYQGAHGKAVYVPCVEYFKTNSLAFLEKANYRKQIKFQEVGGETRKALRRLEADKIYSETQQLSASEIYWRRPLRRR